MQLESSSRQTEQPHHSERQSRVASLLSRLLRRPHQAPHSNIQVTGDTPGIFSEELLTITSEELRERYCIDGPVTIVTKRMGRNIEGKDPNDGDWA